MARPKLTPFRESVLICVEKVPLGKVLSCGQVSGPARAWVPRALHYLVENGFPDLPWHRVVNSDGSLLPTKMFVGQGERLRDEQVEFRPDGKVDMKKSCPS